jgi:hypothetical protein
MFPQIFEMRLGCSGSLSQLQLSRSSVSVTVPAFPKRLPKLIVLGSPKPFPKTKVSGTVSGEPKLIVSGCPKLFPKQKVSETV